LIVLADLLTFSRGGYIGIVFGTIFGLILLWPRLTIFVRHLIFALFISLIIIIAIPQNPFTKRLLSSFDKYDTSNSHRIELWHTTLQIIKNEPLLGTGLGAFPLEIDPRATYRKPIYAHNLLLDITVELGIFGLILFCCIFIRLFYVLYKNHHNYTALFAIISLVIFLSHSIFDTAIFSVHVLPILLLIISIGIYYEVNPHNTKPITVCN